MQAVKETAHKLKEAITPHNNSSTTHSTTHGTTSGTTTHTGPHASNAANMADPRVDSDRDGSHNLGATGGLTGTTGTHHTSGLTGTHHTTGTTHNTAGPHSSNLANKVDPRVDSDRDGSHNLGATGGLTGATHTSGLTGSHHTTGTHSTGTHSTGTHSTGTHTSTAGPHSSDMANKLDPRVDSDRDGSRNLGLASGTTGTGLTGATGTHHTTGTTHHTSGPHSSNLANKADPRVDSDRDGSHNLGGTGGLTGTTHSSGLTGSHHTTGLTGTHHTTTAGPHSSNLANKADPRVDSDRDGSHNLGGAGGLTGTTGTHHTSGLTGSHQTTGLTGTHHTTGTTHNTAGPHSSNLANKVDPRVDSDRDGSHNLGGAGGLTGTTGTHHTSGLTGSHHTGTTGTTGGLTGSTGTATHSSGPHKSDLLNKLDPRVDSDNSKAHSRIDSGSGVGSGTQFGASHSTYPAASGNTKHSHGLNQPFDASIHKPSEAREILGESAVTHGGDPYDHKRRHSTTVPREDIDKYGPGHQ